jgi:hypothetical protein
MTALTIPVGLERLIAAGVWPSAGGPSMIAQHDHPLVGAERVRQFAPEETLICLQPPPFPTVAMEMAKGRSGDFWQRFGALHQIVPEQTLIIGDFGMGSDAPIALDFAANSSDPPVIRLRWRGGEPNAWVRGAANFDEFAAMLGLAGVA